MSKTTHYELNTPIGSEVLSVMTGLNPNFTAIDGVMYDNETRSTQALNKANVNEQNIATALGRITTAEGDIDTLESGLETANTNISGLTSRMGTAENGLVSANNRIQENTNSINTINTNIADINANKRCDTRNATNLLGYNSASNYFTAPSDGYVSCQVWNNDSTIDLWIELEMIDVKIRYDAEKSYCVFAKKGTRYYITGSGNNRSCSFAPLVTY
jgi:hypothetical protein